MAKVSSIFFYVEEILTEHHGPAGFAHELRDNISAWDTHSHTGIKNIWERGGKPLEKCCFISHGSCTESCLKIDILISITSQLRRDCLLGGISDACGINCKLLSYYITVSTNQCKVYFLAISIRVLAVNYTGKTTVSFSVQSTLYNRANAGSHHPSISFPERAPPVPHPSPSQPFRGSSLGQWPFIHPTTSSKWDITSSAASLIANELFRAHNVIQGDLPGIHWHRLNCLHFQYRVTFSAKVHCTIWHSSQSIHRQISFTYNVPTLQPNTIIENFLLCAH